MTHLDATLHRSECLSDEGRRSDGASTLGLSVLGSLSTFSMAVRVSNPPTTLKEKTFPHTTVRKVKQNAMYDSRALKQLLVVNLINEQAVMSDITSVSKGVPTKANNPDITGDISYSENAVW